MWHLLEVDVLRAKVKALESALVAADAALDSGERPALDPYALEALARDPVNLHIGPGAAFWFTASGLAIGDSVVLTSDRSIRKTLASGFATVTRVDGKKVLITVKEGPKVYRSLTIDGARYTGYTADPKYPDCASCGHTEDEHGNTGPDESPCFSGCTCVEYQRP